ncbi:MAG: hypothetical protein ACRD2C_25075 [Acidimicrobiales bacterium]
MSGSEEVQVRAAVRRFRLGVLGVVVASTLVFGWFLTIGRGDLLARSSQGDFFDIQARSILDGHLHAEEGDYGFEGFVVDGKTYTYFGVFPSLLRLPVLLVTDDLDGRLTVPSMVLAYLVAMISTALLVHRVRELARPAAPWATAELLVTGALLVVVGIGSNLLFVAGNPWVYTEAALWGAAGVLASFAAVVAFLHRPGGRSIALAGAWAGVAWLSRGSVGLAPTLALGLLGVAHLTGWRVVRLLAPPADPHDEAWSRDRPRAAGLIAAALVPALAFAVVNQAKFGSPASTPFGRQVWSEISPIRQAVLEEYGGNLFSLRLVVPNLVQDLRPDLVRPSGLWPFVDFTRHQPPTFGGVVYDTVDPSAGLLLTAPALVALAALGAVAVFRRRRLTATGRPAALAALRPLVLGGAVAAFVPLTIAFVAQRYLTDAVPLLVVAASAGLVVLDPGGGRGSIGHRVALGVGGVLAVVGIYVTVSTTWVYQRFVSPPDTAAEVAGLRARQEVSDLLGTARVRVRHVASLGDASRHDGDYVVVGECEGLYRAAGDGWVPLEVTSARGHYVGRLVFADDVADAGLRDRMPVPVLAVGDPSDHIVVGLEPVGETQARIVVGRGGDTVDRGEPFGLPWDDSHKVDVWADPALRSVFVDVDGNRVYVALTAGSVQGDVHWGSNPFGGAVAADLPGRVIPSETTTPTCDLLTGAD